jgi:3-deoxy-D-manno-octulosonic-acid transferase
MRYFYSLLFYIATPFILLRLFWRSWRLPGYRERIPERFGYFTAPKIRGGLWVHAVSLGEVNAALPLIKAFQQKHPDMPLTITTLTVSGSQRVRELFGDKVFHVYLPYDLPGAVTRFLKKLQPQWLVLIETELWPNVLYQCQQQHIPVILANARLSERSAKGYSKIASLTRAMLQGMQIIAVQTEAEAKRFIALGARENAVKVTGSVKFDLELPADLRERATILRQQWGQNRPIWIAASTHDGEEELILKAFTQLRLSIPDSLLVLVPRHPDRFAKVAALCRQQNFNIVLRSEGQACGIDTNIFVGDTLGELLLFYAASDVAFVGGSLIPIGGHNVLEPAALAIPIITGIYTFNFDEITNELQAVGAVFRVEGSEQLASTVLHLLQNTALRQESGQQGRNMMSRNRGSLERQLNLLEEMVLKNNES